MAELYTVSGDVLLIDEEDVPSLHGKRLYTLRTRRLTYATFVEKRPDGRQRSVLVHRFILGAAKGTQIDHVNGDGLDCQRSNLRVATHAQNQANRRAESTGSSQYRGVTRLGTDRWAARIQPRSSPVNLGVFATEEAAARAFDRAAVETWGGFARLNFPDQPLATPEEIEAARLTVVRGASRFRGVSWEARTGSWTAKIRTGGKNYWGGRHSTEEDAARAYDRLARDVWGERAQGRLNFPEQM